VTCSYLLVSSVAAQPQTESESAPPPSPHPEIAQTLAPDQTLLKQAHAIELLEAQLQAQKEFQASLLDTVYWALGAVFFLTGIILGLGWLANFKVYERDKEALQRNLDARLSEEKAKLLTAISERHQHLDETVGKNLDAAQKKIAAAANQRIDELTSRILSIEFDRSKEELDATSNHDIALTRALGLLEFCTESRPEEIAELLNFMLKKIAKGGKFTADEITRLTIILDELPAQYSALSEKLRGKLVASDIFGADFD
jgi:hypothetical protein